MSEFQNRVNLQRKVITLVNSKLRFNEPLASLSFNCITRWKNTNHQVLSETSEILLDLSNRVLFLATKSQEQITDEYAYKSAEAVKKIQVLDQHIQKFY